jgi:hypothetical protein
MKKVSKMGVFNFFNWYYPFVKRRAAERQPIALSIRSAVAGVPNASRTPRTGCESKVAILHYKV